VSGPQASLLPSRELCTTLPLIDRSMWMGRWNSAADHAVRAVERLHFIARPRESRSTRSGAARANSRQSTRSDQCVWDEGRLGCGRPALLGSIGSRLQENSAPAPARAWSRGVVSLATRSHR
jgi:hypothetical protein